MRILQPAGSAAAMIEDTNMKRRNSRQEVIVMLKTPIWNREEEEKENPQVSWEVRVLCSNVLFFLPHVTLLAHITFSTTDRQRLLVLSGKSSHQWILGFSTNIRIGTLHMFRLETHLIRSPPGYQDSWHDRYPKIGAKTWPSSGRLKYSQLYNCRHKRWCCQRLRALTLLLLHNTHLNILTLLDPYSVGLELQ